MRINIHFMEKFIDYFFEINKNILWVALRIGHKNFKD